MLLAFNRACHSPERCLVCQQISFLIRASGLQEAGFLFLKLNHAEALGQDQNPYITPIVLAFLSMSPKAMLS